MCFILSSSPNKVIQYIAAVSLPQYTFYMIRLRRATRNDVRAIRDLIWRVKINPLSLNWQRFLVAVDDHDHLIGCGQIKPHRDGSRELASIAVQPEWQGQGIGHMIVAHLLAENALPLYLTCRSMMEPYYEEFGFQSVKPEEMTAYFRRLFQLSQVLRLLSPEMDEMSVMKKTA